jgi:Na+-transporting NADH:ubiquinone oxidoreductase subunit C
MAVSEPYLDVKKQQTSQKKKKVRQPPSFRRKEQSSKTLFYVAPIRGKGLDAIYCVAVDEDKVKFKETYFDHKGETPGLQRPFHG